MQEEEPFDDVPNTNDLDGGAGIIPSSSSALVMEDDEDIQHRSASASGDDDDGDDGDGDDNNSNSNNNNNSTNVARVPSSSLDDDDSGTTHRHHHLVPPLPERTLKEKLVERERQKRIETERARLKRQFALSNSDGHHHDDDSAVVASFFNQQNGEGQKAESLVGTVGDGSSVAADGVMNDGDLMGMMNHPNPEKEKSEKLGYAMERFLNERDSKQQAATVTSSATAVGVGDTNAAPATNIVDEAKPRAEPEPGVFVMERFLSEPVVVMDEPPRPPDEDDNVVVVVDTTPSPHQEHHNDDERQLAAPQSTASVTFDDDVINHHLDHIRHHHHDSIGMQPPNHQPPSHRSMGSEVSATAGSLALSSVGEPDEGVGSTGMDDSMEVRTNASSRDNNNHRLLDIMDDHAGVTVGFTTNDLRRGSSGGPDSPSQARASSSISSLPSTNTNDHHHHHHHSNNSNNQPVVTRVLRLTEREIQEMAAIEEASIGNAPPSEREDTLSEVGDLVSPFREMDHHHHHEGGFSVNTRTTASVSNTSLGGNQSDPNDDRDHGRQSSSHMLSQDAQQEEDHRSIIMDEHNSIDGIATASVSSHLALSPGGSEGGVSVTVNPPSVIANNEGQHHASMLIPDDDDDDMHHDSPNANDGVPSSIPITVISDTIPVVRIPDIPTFDDDEPLDAEASAIANANVVNRRLRPGMTATPTARGGRQQHQEVALDAALPATPSREMKRTFSMPEKMHVSLDGFDYDKYDFVLPTTPRSQADSFGDLPRGDDQLLWTPNANVAIAAAAATGSALDVSPLRGASSNNRKPTPPMLGISTTGDVKLVAKNQPESDLTDPAYRVNYGSLGGSSMSAEHNGNTREVRRGSSESSFTDRDALLPSGGKGENSSGSMANSIFSSIQSDSVHSVHEKSNEADVYRTSSLWKRAFPERFFALLVTLIVEIPVLLMISGGSDRLCLLVGRRRYQLLIGFLPLSSAISGNCGLQASTLTTRAISHNQVTVENFQIWFRTEVAAAAMLGLGMGFVLGFAGFMVSGYDIPFGITIFIAQFVSILTAGVTGTLAPLIFTFIFRRDSGKWGGPLETAIQDIVGSFAMVVLSYHVLVFFGPHAVEESDTCGGD